MGTFIFRYLDILVDHKCISPFCLLTTNILLFVLQEQDSSQNLRTALEQKARQGGGGKKKLRGKRKMKPGQAKTLSDLPQLNT